MKSLNFPKNIEIFQTQKYTQGMAYLEKLSKRINIGPKQNIQTYVEIFLKYAQPIGNFQNLINPKK